MSFVFLVNFDDFLIILQRRMIDKFSDTYPVSCFLSSIIFAMRLFRWIIKLNNVDALKPVYSWIKQRQSISRSAFCLSVILFKFVLLIPILLVLCTYNLKNAIKILKNQILKFLFNSLYIFQVYDFISWSRNGSLCIALIDMRCWGRDIQWWCGKI